MPADGVKMSLRELGFPDFNVLCDAANEISFPKEITSNDVEEILAKRFQISNEQRQFRKQNGVTRWANYIHFVLVRLQKRNLWEKTREGHAADGGVISVYRRVANGTPHNNASPPPRTLTPPNVGVAAAGPSVEFSHADEDDIVEIEEGPTYTLDDIIADGCFLPHEELSDILARWRSKKNLVLQGPPGTGKTWLAKRLGFALVGSNDRETSRSRLRVVQFHPSLAYEDFVRGWRPAGDGRLALVDGILMQAIEAAASEPDRPFVLVIEEINRGNPAQIFGEMLTLLENTKRRRSEAIELAYRKVTGERIHVPGNLYVIGTMNVADRSLAIVDLALRRRFAFVDLEPQLGRAWRNWCARHGLGDAICSEIEIRISALNSHITAALSLGPQFRIGHSYVTPDIEETVRDGQAWFRARVDTEIGPLLDEYWYDAPETAKAARAKLLAGLV